MSPFKVGDTVKVLAQGLTFTGHVGTVYAICPNKDIEVIFDNNGNGAIFSEWELGFFNKKGGEVMESKFKVGDYVRIIYPRHSCTGKTGVVTEKTYIDSYKVNTGASHYWWHEHQLERVESYPPPPPKMDGAAGLKHDQGKPDLSLLSPIALIKIAQVMDFGAKKYEAHNWRKGFKWTRIAAAALRHLFSWIGGEDKDPESGLSHLAHAACCLLFLLEFETTKPDMDDRYKGDKKCQK